RFGMLRRNSARDGRNAIVQLLVHDVRPRTTNDAQVVRAALRCRKIEIEGQPNIGVTCGGESLECNRRWKRRGGSHADDCVRDAIDVNAAANYIARTAEASVP